MDKNMQPFVIVQGLIGTHGQNGRDKATCKTNIHKFAYLISSPLHLSDAQFTTKKYVVWDIVIPL